MTTKRDGERPTVKLQPRELAALLHEPQPGALETDAQTIELLPLTDAIADTADPEPEPAPAPPPRLACGSDSVAPTGSPTIRMKPRRTRSKLRVDAITAGLPKKKP